MAVKPNTPDRSDLESKSREDLQAIAKLTGADVSARASKATLIETIMGSPANAASNSDAARPKPATRAVRSRRTVATPDDDFESLINEFTADAPASAAATTAAPAPSARGQSTRRGAQRLHGALTVGRARSRRLGQRQWRERSAERSPRSAEQPAARAREPREPRQPRDFAQRARWAQQPPQPSQP